MMYDWQKQAEQYVPPVLPSYNYVCRIPVFIPIQEIGMTVWERQIQSLSFIHESVLSAICFGAKTVNELSYQFGLPEVLVLEIISQLDTEQLAAISAGSIVLTVKGRMALQQQQKVVIMRKQFSSVYINQITGEISDIAPVGTYREPEFGKVYLGEKHQITTEFLRNNFEALSAIYQEGHIENIAFERKMVANAELYRILDISYHKLSYIKEYCFVYVNQDDKSLAFRFQSGIQAYADTMIEQLGNHHCGPWNLLSHPVTPSPVAGECVVESLPLNLIEAYHAVGDQDIRLAKIEACYNENRPLLDGEIQDILCNSHVFKAKQVFICAPFLSDILNESAITGLLTQHLKKIIIHTDPTDRKAENIISDIEKLLKSRKNPVELIVVKKTITSVCIYLDVFCTIRGCYYRKQTVYRRDIFKLCSEVSFDQIKNEQLWLTI